MMKGTAQKTGVQKLIFFLRYVVNFYFFFSSENYFVLYTLRNASITVEKKAEGAHNRLRWPLKTSEAEDGAKFMTCRAGTGRPPPPDRATNPGTLCLATYSF